MEMMSIEYMRFLLIEHKSATILSFKNCGYLEMYNTRPYLPPNWKYLFLNTGALGQMSSLNERPVFALYDKLKSKYSSSPFL